MEFLKSFFYGEKSDLIPVAKKEKTDEDIEIEDQQLIRNIKDFSVKGPEGSSKVNYSTPIDQNLLKNIETKLSEKSDKYSIYSTFLDTVEKMMKIIPDEKTRLQASFVTLNTTKDVLLTHIDICLELLENEEKRGMDALDKIVKELMETKVVELDNQKSNIEKKHTEIQRLTQEISDLTKQVESLEKEVAEKQTDIETKKSIFIATIQEIEKQIISDKDKINKYVT